MAMKLFQDNAKAMGIKDFKIAYGLDPCDPSVGHDMHRDRLEGRGNQPRANDNGNQQLDREVGGSQASQNVIRKPRGQA